MELNAIYFVTPRGKKPTFYLARSDVGKVQALQLSGEDVELTGGRYDTRPAIGKEKGMQRTPFVRVFGIADADPQPSATIVGVMDGVRELPYPVRGMFDRAKRVLFYQEFPPEATDNYEFHASVRDVKGKNLEIYEVEVGLVPLG